MSGQLAYENKNTPQINQDKTLLISMIADDLNRKMPVYVFVDKNKNHVAANLLNFDYISYFSANSDFQAAWKKYHYVRTLKKADGYTFDIYEHN